VRVGLDGAGEGKGKGEGEEEKGNEDREQLHNVIDLFFTFLYADSGGARRGSWVPLQRWGWFEAARGPAKTPVSVCQASSLGVSWRRIRLDLSIWPQNVSDGC
jgi:hypothetical protein